MMETDNRIAAREEADRRNNKNNKDKENGEKLPVPYIIVVEGRDDTAAVKRAVDALTLETHGYGISAKTWKLLEEAHHKKGLLILTDPDHAGEEIRRRVTERFPEALQAFLPRRDATDGTDIGVENAAPEAIVAALRKAHAFLPRQRAGFLEKRIEAAATASTADAPGAAAEKTGIPDTAAKATSSPDEAEEPPFTKEDLWKTGLAGDAFSKEMRSFVGELLGIGYANAHTFLKRLNGMGIAHADFLRAVEKAQKEGKYMPYCGKKK